MQEGEVCKYAAFVVKGALRQYRVDDKGMEHILRLSIENWWASDRESYIMLTLPGTILMRGKKAMCYFLQEPITWQVKLDHLPSMK